MTTVLPGAGSGEARASAAFQRLRVYANATSGPPVQQGNEILTAAGGASASARFVDGWTIDSITLSGPGSVQLDFVVDGVIVGPIRQPYVSPAGAGWMLAVNGSIVLESWDYASGQGRAGGSVQVVVPFTPGVPFALDVQFTASANAAYLDGYHASTADYGSTVTLANLHVLDGQGQPVSAYSFVPESGFAYQFPIPEPSTAALFGVGVTVLGASRRRGRIGTAGAGGDVAS